MANDVNPALTAELNAALDVLDSETRGLTALAAMPGSDPLKNELSLQLTSRARRRVLIEALIEALAAATMARDALIAEGYPSMPRASVPPALMNELKGDALDLHSAVNVFEELLQASAMAVSLGAASPKDNTPTAKQKD
jgi:hypothetical protein